MTSMIGMIGTTSMTSMIGMISQVHPWHDHGWAFWPDLSSFTIMHWMGLLALAILWVNMLLIAYAALLEVPPLRARLARLGASRRGGVVLVRGEVVRGDGPGGALADHVVDQLGRSNGDRFVHFHDRGFTSTLHGGVVRLTDGREVTIAGDQPIAVWPTRAEVRRAGACASSEAFAAAHAAACKARGFARALTTSIGAGAQVWISGALEEDRSGLQLHAPLGGPLLVSTVHPSRWTLGKVALCCGYAALTILVTLGCSIAALWPPVFGTVSTVGAVAGAAALLSNMLFGTQIRDAVRPPSRAFVRGAWQEPRA
ncbi:MAG: hypothetical protein KC636_39635 [Myxococcales bacterium]|nr:hypothetical protein [Myxococcales bacterium]